MPFTTSQPVIFFKPKLPTGTTNEVLTNRRRSVKAATMCYKKPMPVLKILHQQ